MADSTPSNFPELELSNLYGFDETNGTIAPADYGEVADIVESEIKYVFGLDGNEEINTSTPLGRMIEWLSIHFTEVLQLNVQNANQLLLSAAAGQQLDAMAQWFQLYRKPQGYTTVVATLSGTAGTEIPAGSRARTDEGYYFASTSTITIGANGSATVIFSSLLPGAIPCAAGALKNIDTPRMGWDTITNDAPGHLGSLIETDDSLRERINNDRTTAIGFLGAIKNAIEKVASIKSSNVLENNTNAYLGIQAIALSPHSIFVCVDGDGSEEEQEAVAKAIFENKPCGTGYSTLKKMNNDAVIPTEITKTVLDAYGNPYTVVFYRPVDTAVNTYINVVRRNYTGINLEAEITEAVANWFATESPAIGETIFASDIMTFIENNVPGIVILESKVAIGGIESATQYVEIGGWQKAIKGNVVIVEK